MPDEECSHCLRFSGRFEDQFIETRRAALEKCLNKMANHPVLSLDPDLRLFLESESFEFEVRHVTLWVSVDTECRLDRSNTENTRLHKVRKVKDY